MGIALASSPQASPGLITRRVTDKGSIVHLIVVAFGIFLITNTLWDATDGATPKRSQPSSRLLMRSWQVLSSPETSARMRRNLKPPSSDDTNRLTKPACVQISSLLHARRH